MTLAQLRYTIAIAKAGSMNEAAKSLYISQPSLSTAIRELEAETGVEIFRISGVCKAGGGTVRTDGSQIYFQGTVTQKIQCFHAALYLCS